MYVIMDGRAGNNRRRFWDLFSCPIYSSIESSLLSLWWIFLLSRLLSFQYSCLSKRISSRFMHLKVTLLNSIPKTSTFSEVHLDIFQNWNTFIFVHMGVSVLSSWPSDWLIPSWLMIDHFNRGREGITQISIVYRIIIKKKKNL